VKHINMFAFVLDDAAFPPDNEEDEKKSTFILTSESAPAQERPPERPQVPAPPERHPVPALSPGRAPDHQLSPERALVPEYTCDMSVMH